MVKLNGWIFIEDDVLLKKHDDISNKGSNSKEHDSKSIYNKKFLKTIIRSYGHDATNFHDD